jgi:hypothetical protein
VRAGWPAAGVVVGEGPPATGGRRSTSAPAKTVPSTATTKSPATSASSGGRLGGLGRRGSNRTPGVYAAIRELSDFEHRKSVLIIQIILF